MTALVDLPDAQFYCLRGAYGHDWDEYQPLRRRNQWGQPVNLRCVRCEKKRLDVYDSTGGLSYRTYEVPDWHAKVDAHDTGDVRRELVRRARARARARVAA